MELLRLVLGANTFSEWVFCGFLSLLGFIFLKIVHYETRTNKGIKFSVRYWINDNKIEFILGCIMFYIVFRFNADVLAYLGNKFNIPLMEDKFIYMFLFGLFGQYLFKRARKFLSIRDKNNSCGKERNQNLKK